MRRYRSLLVSVVRIHDIPSRWDVVLSFQEGDIISQGADRYQRFLRMNAGQLSSRRAAWSGEVATVDSIVRQCGVRPTRDWAPLYMGSRSVESGSQNTRLSPAPSALKSEVQLAASTRIVLLLYQIFELAAD